MSVRTMDIETLLEVINADRLVLRFGNQRKDSPYLELEIHEAIARDGKITYTIKELSETGYMNYPMASPLSRGATIGEVDRQLSDIKKLTKRRPERVEK